MALTPKDIENLVAEIQRDLTIAKAKLVTLSEWAAQMPPGDPAPEYRCDSCGVVHASRMKLLDHAVLVHEDRAAEAEREAEWERLAELAGEGGPTPRQTSFEEDPEQRRRIAAELRARFDPDLEPRLGTPEPTLG